MKSCWVTVSISPSDPGCHHQGFTVTGSEGPWGPARSPGSRSHLRLVLLHPGAGPHPG